MEEPTPLPNGDDATVALRAAVRERAASYEFFQAVRTLALAGSGEPVGHDFHPRSEMVRFRTHLSLAYPPGQITRFDYERKRQEGEGDQPALEVAFLGLVGPAGVLPRHYTETVIARVRAKDYALRDFLDLFNHRVLSLFYRAWEKHQIGPLLENAANAGEVDRFSKALASLVALGPKGSRDRFDFDDRLFLYFGGVFSRYPRCASSLERLVQQFLRAPARVLQFVGQWLRLDTGDQTQVGLLGGAGNCGLGVNTIAGERVWDVQSKFRLRLGPLSYEDFLRLAPGGSTLTPLGQLVRSYVGPDLDFDVQPVLRRAEVPECRLAGASGPVPCLAGIRGYARSRCIVTRTMRFLFPMGPQRDNLSSASGSTAPTKISILG